MSDPKSMSHGTQPPPWRGHPLPRRTPPEKSVTLRHHRLARDASLRDNLALTGATRVENMRPSSPRRNSSGGSHHTGNSDPKRWFDQSNQNPSAAFDGNAMDVDPPFFQKESDSSNEGGRKDGYRFDEATGPNAALRPKLVRQSSSTDDYRSVIDDLTVEIQRLKDELKRYKQLGPDMMKKDKLFEIKMHGLPRRKKQELEATLRDFAASLDGTTTSNATSSQRKNSSRNMYSASGSLSKHASSSSGSRSRPVDSAYASMSTGHNSSGTSLSRPSMSSRARTSDQKVESYLKDIPEGLYPRHMTMTDKDKKKLVVRRLEQLFTGKITGRHFRRNQTGGHLGPVVTEAQQPSATAVPGAPSSGRPSSNPEPLREARIAAPDASNKKTRSRDNGSASNSNGDQTDSGGNGNGNGNGSRSHSRNGNGNGDGGNSSGGVGTSPPSTLLEQRPTRPRDLDPDRVQIPSENMEYIRHLGLVPPELLPEARPTQDVSPDADGWVYLNLLANLAQLHMINVAPDFIRSAVSEKSTKFQLSPDGRKIRWRGGCDCTKFSSDSSGDNSQKSPLTEDTDSSNKEGQRKRTKTKHSPDDASAPSCNNLAKLGAQASGLSEPGGFHYQPLFVRQWSSEGQTSQDDTSSSFGPGEGEDSNPSGGWGRPRSGASQRRKKRRLDGAIIYYSGAPFCTDLSGDPGDLSPTSYLDSNRQDSSTLPGPKKEAMRPPPARSDSGSMLHFRPLSQKTPANYEMDIERSGALYGLKRDVVDDDDDDNSDDVQLDLPWSSDQQVLPANTLEPCGLGGVRPDDHFMVVVTTKRPRVDSSIVEAPPVPRAQSSETADSIVSRLATMTTGSGSGSAPAPLRKCWSTSSREKLVPVEMDYVSGRIKRLAPVPLPPPAMFYPPFSTDESGTSSSYGSEADEDEDVMSSSELTSRRANPHQSLHQSDNTYPDDIEVSSRDEERDELDDDMVMKGSVDDDDDEEEDEGSDEAMDDDRRRPGQPMSGARAIHGGSSAATAGGRESGYGSSAEDEH